MRNQRWHEFFKTAQPLANPTAYDGNIFISHAGRDSERIVKALINPMNLRTDSKGDLFNDGAFCFFHSTKDGMGYVDSVLTALTNCAGAIVVGTANSRGHPWVYAEIDWLLAHRKRVCICRLDRVSPSKLHEALPALGFFGRGHPGVFDFFRSTLPYSDLDEWTKECVARADLFPGLRPYTRDE